MVSNGYGQPFQWALARLREEFGEERVSLEVAEDGGAVVAEVRTESDDDRRPYRVILKDPVLGDVNRVADPKAFLDAEVDYARHWCAGESKRYRTYG